jgi:uncharacterized membrane protein
MVPSARWACRFERDQRDGRTADKALESLSKFGGNVIKTSLSKGAEAELQQELHGSGA